MGKRRSILISGLLILLVLLVIFITLYANLYNKIYSTAAQRADFWKDFSPQILATVFGVSGSIIFAAALWIWQQKDQDRFTREQLLKDLELEVEQNLKILEKNEFILDTIWDKKNRVEDYFEFTEKLLVMTPLRRAAIEKLLKCENATLVNLPELEWKLSSLNKNVEVFNDYINSIAIPRLEAGVWYSEEAICNNLQSVRMAVRSGFDRNNNLLKEIRADLKEIQLKKKN